MYTVLRVLPSRDVLLYAEHRRRFAGAEAAFDAWCESAVEGIYALTWAGAMQVRRIERSRLEDGMPARVLPTPLAANAGRIAKPPPGGIYANVRAEGIATLLTLGEELCEESSAAIVSCEAETVIFPPDTTPRVRSTAEDTVRQQLPHKFQTIRAGMPLLLLNAVKGTCAIDGHRFPPDVRRRIDDALRSTAARPNR